MLALQMIGRILQCEAGLTDPCKTAIITAGYLPKQPYDKREQQHENL